MGCGVFLVWSELVAELAWPGVNLLLIGGAVYLIGVVFFILAEYKPIYHAIWHLFVVLAATLHWFAIYLFVLRTDIGEAAIKATSAYAEQYGVDLHLSQAINK